MKLKISESGVQGTSAGSVFPRVKSKRKSSYRKPSGQTLRVNI